MKKDASLKGQLKENTVFKIFSDWLKENERQFKHKPVFLKKSRTYVEYMFEGINPMITFILRKSSSIDVLVTYEEEVFDQLLYIQLVDEGFDDNGFFCKLCEPSKHQFYKTREELLSKHTFEYLLDWANENLIESNILRLVEIGVFSKVDNDYVPGMRYAQIINRYKANSVNSYLLKLKPIHKLDLCHNFPVVIKGEMN